MIQTAVSAPMMNAPSVRTITTQKGPHHSSIMSLKIRPSRYRIAGFYPPHG
jgi:hypothetical protein